MQDVKSVHLTGNGNVETLSRHSMLIWVNETSSIRHNKIEELCSGVAYCQIMEHLFPGSIGIKKIKVNAKLEHEFVCNLKLFQGAFTKLKYDKTVPIDRLVKGRFQDNFEFLQWFKKFYDTLSGGNKENFVAPKAPVIRKATSTTNDKTTSTGLAKKTLPKVNSEENLAVPTSRNLSRPVSPASVNNLKADILELKDKIDTIKTERDFYHKKVERIEALCGQIENENDEEAAFVKKIFLKIYQKEDQNPQMPNSDQENDEY